MSGVVKTPAPEGPEAEGPEAEGPSNAKYAFFETDIAVGRGLF